MARGVGGHRLGALGDGDRVERLSAGPAAAPRAGGASRPRRSPAARREQRGQEEVLTAPRATMRDRAGAALACRGLPNAAAGAAGGLQACRAAERTRIAGARRDAAATRP
jgi:hypothetical protein